jgi:hypothetical protein
MAKISTIIVVLGIPNTITGVITRSYEIVDAMGKNTLVFKNPPVAFTVSTGHIDDLVTANTAAQTRAKGMVSARDDKKKLVVEDMHQYHGYVQTLANASPADAATIAQAAAMRLRNAGSIHKSDLAVKHVVSGTVQLVAKAIKGGRAHEWEVSTDGGKTWTSVPATLAAHTTVTGLTPGVMTTFRHRTITKSGAADWSSPVSFLVG